MTNFALVIERIYGSDDKEIVKELRLFAEEHFPSNAFAIFTATDKGNTIVDIELSMLMERYDVLLLVDDVECELHSQEYDSDQGTLIIRYNHPIHPNWVAWKAFGRDDPLSVRVKSPNFVCDFVNWAW